MAFRSGSEAFVDGLEGFVFGNSESGIEIFNVEFFHVDACIEGGCRAGFTFSIEAVVERLCCGVDEVAFERQLLDFGVVLDEVVFERLIMACFGAWNILKLPEFRMDLAERIVELIGEPLFVQLLHERVPDRGACLRSLGTNPREAGNEECAEDECMFWLHRRRDRGVSLLSFRVNMGMSRGGDLYKESL